MLTPRQEHASAPDHHLAVTANAGSGKTMVLVERYVRLTVDRAVDVGSVVAMTFTEKAASELKRKIAQRIGEELVLSSGSGRAARLERVRAQLPAAVIGTIHSFCARLLREHPVEAGVDAAFTVLEGLDQRILMEECMRETLHHLLRGSSGDPLRQPVYDLVRTIGKERTLRFVSSIIQKRERLIRWSEGAGPYAMTDAGLLSLWKNAITSFVETGLADPALHADLQQIVDASMPAKEIVARDLLATVTGNVAIAERAAALIELMEFATTLKGEISKRFAGERAVDRDVAAAGRRISRWRKNLRDVLEQVVDSRYDRSLAELVAVTRVLLAVATAVIDRYAARKLEAGCLDFEDLQLGARQLLKDEAVRRHLQDRFQYVMVDEYQDTNRLQYEILLPLLDGLAKGNLFIVGDPKQSIYGFRNADVTVFHTTRRDILAVAGPGGEVVLGESFRPLRDIASFINLVFSRVMANGENAGVEGEPAYDPLVRARPSALPGRVEVLLRDDGEVDSRVTESDRIARRILALVRSGHTILDRNGEPSVLRFGDMAVLLRSRTTLPETEQAFIRYGVPFIVTGGVGYFQTQDVLDFYCFLAFLLDPSDDASLAGILRAPFFGVSDAELLDVACLRGSESLWSCLVRNRGNDSISPSIARATAALLEDLAVAPTLPVPDLLGRIVERTLYEPKISGTARGEQALANLEKLRGMARAFEEQGFTTLFDFVSRLRTLIDEEHDEGQGPVAARGDAVQIMTIHAAKGLEFPAVVVPNLHRQFQYDREPYMDDTLGVGFMTDDDEDEHRAHALPIVALMKTQSRARTIAEEKRIFYVALTRARDLLLLSGVVTAGRESPSYLNWLLEALRIESVPSSGTLLYECRTESLDLQKDGFVRGSESHVLPVHVLREEDIPSLPVEVEEASGGGEPPRVVLEEIVSSEQGEMFSATRIRTYIECPSRYYFRYVLGYPEREGEKRIEDADELVERGIPAGLFGRVFHAVMQKIDTLEHDDGVLLHEARRVAMLERTIGDSLVHSLAEQVTHQVRSVLSSPFWSEASKGTEVRTEFTISAPLGGHFIVGTIDRLFRGRDGIVTIVDYKTDAVTLETAASRAMSYAPQVDLYALLAGKFLGVSSVRVVLLFTAIPGQPLTRLLGESDLAAVEQDIQSVIVRIETGDFRPGPERCPGCPFSPGFCHRVLHGKS